MLSVYRFTENESKSHCRVYYLRSVCAEIVMETHLWSVEKPFDIKIDHGIGTHDSKYHLNQTRNRSRHTLETFFYGRSRKPQKIEHVEWRTFTVFSQPICGRNDNDRKNIPFDTHLRSDLVGNVHSKRLEWHTQYMYRGWKKNNVYFLQSRNYSKPLFMLAFDGS